MRLKDKVAIVTGAGPPHLPRQPKEPLLSQSPVHSPTWMKPYG